jgi:hypothetical protein
MSRTHSTFVTPKGTTLNLLSLKGKPYLMAADRILWFRESNPRGVVKTQILHHQDEIAVVRAEIFVETERGQTQLVASAHKTESKSSFPDYIEKAETSAIARALAMAGYGTQFTGDELDEKDRLADAPLNSIPTKTSFRKKKAVAAVVEPTTDDI